MKNLKAMSLPELGEYQRELEAARKPGDIENYAARGLVEAEIREREEAIEEELATAGRRRFIEKHGVEAYADARNC